MVSTKILSSTSILILLIVFVVVCVFVFLSTKSEYKNDFWMVMCHESGCLSPHYSCTSPMDYNSHHSLHYDTHSSIHHCTNYTAVTNQPWLSCHTCTSFTHPHISSTLPYTRCEVLFLPRLTFLSVIHPAICYLCVWLWTARPWNSEPVLVTSTPAWYCLHLCSASDIPVIARWPLPVWFCLINLTASGSTHLRPVITSCDTEVWVMVGEKSVLASLKS